MQFPSAERILISCVAENREPCITEVQYLFHSLAAFGGRLARALRIAHFVDAANAEVVEQLSQIGVIVKVVEPLDRRCPHANKIRMLEDQEDYDVLVALDCDVVIAKDFLSVINPNVVMAKPVDSDPLKINQWKSLFRHFGLSCPRERYLTAFDRTETIPYFNSGVVIIPKQFVASLSAAWEMFILTLLDLYDRFPDIAAHRFFTDQFALALALNKQKIPCKALPIEMNFPLHYPIHASFQPEKIIPYVFHHHHSISSEGVMPCTYQNMNQTIRKINTVLTGPLPKLSKASLRRANPGFDNSNFWENRYSTDLKLGSGLGSRGKCLVYKQDILRKLISERLPASVLDVGCGDLEVTSRLPFENYVGIDISNFIVNRNRQLKPNWSFRAGDFLKIVAEEQLAADLVICLDVLIHEHDAQRYAQMVQRLVEVTKVTGLIGAYELPPRNGFSSDITAYHEPITETLKRAGAHDIEVIGYYHDTSIVCYRTKSTFSTKQFSEAMKENKKDVICIIGMHRSGTSMVARSLKRCGLHLGPEDQLLKPGPDNPLGYYEHTGFLKIDEALLAHFGGSLVNPRDLAVGWEHDPSLEGFIREAKLLVDTFSESCLWGWKEPRATILLPF